MSDPIRFVYNNGGRQPDPVLVLHADGRVTARSAGGEMVEVALTAEDIDRLKGADCPHECRDPTSHTVRVLCEIIARELPRHRPS